MLNSKILFQLSGSISCFKAAQAISTLVQRGHQVKCVATKSALEFIGVATLEGLTGSPVFVDAYEPGRMMDHIHLARWADVFVLCPGTANTINKLAHGIADDVIGQLYLAKGLDKPYLIFPAMNREMYAHPATQESIQKLTQRGVRVLETGAGYQACGETGAGRLLEADQIVKEIEGPPKGLNILVTAGATREKIDDIRFISNISTGSTAATLCDYFITQGHQITYLAGQGALLPTQKAEVVRFTDFESLATLLKKKLSETSYDVIVHAAAVSDYSVSQVVADGKILNRNSKLGSKLSGVSLELKPNKKILGELKKWNPKAVVIAFKLTSHASDQDVIKAIALLASESKPDYIVHNDFSQMKSKDSRVFSFFSSQSSTIAEAKAENTKDLARLILERSLPHDLSP